MLKEVELLAPAGNIKSFYAACNSKADAIYMGIDKFNARAMATNFSIEEYIECIKYAHNLGIKVFLTLNILLNDEEVKEALNIVLELYKEGLDAVIIQDLGLAKKIHEIFPELNMHASTQLSAYSLEQVKFLEKLGFKRVVLARELTLNEIRNICENTNVQIEVFVHGALCVSLSGQCLLSSMIGKRSANRGECAQPCRMRYTLVNKTLNKDVIKDSFLLSKKDIFGADYINALIDAGVYSFKIEGRNKPSEYVALVTQKYRKCLDKNKLSSEEKENICQMFIREKMSEGYLNGVLYKDSITKITPKNTGLFLGVVEGQKGPYIKLKLNQKINLHDGFEIYDKQNNNTLYSNIITCIKDDNLNIINYQNVDKGRYVFIGDVNKKIRLGSLVYKTSDSLLNKMYSNLSKNKPKYNIKIILDENKKMEVISNINNTDIITKIDYEPQLAKNSPITKDKVIENISKTNNDIIEFNNIEVLLEKDLFIPISMINLLRRTHIKNILDYLNNSSKVLSPLEIKKIKQKIEMIDKEEIEKENIIEKYINKKSLYIYRFNIETKYDFSKYDRVYITIQDIMRYKDIILNRFLNSNTKLFVTIPNFVLDNVSNYIYSNLEQLILKGVYGILLGSFHFYDLCIKLKQKYNIILIADYSFNILNKYTALLFKKLNFDIITLSPEISKDKISSISKIINSEVVNDYITVMTTRYCMIGSFDENRKTYKDVCKKPCLNYTYMLKDAFKEEYSLVPDSFDCIIRIVKKKDSRINSSDSINIRECKV